MNNTIQEKHDPIFKDYTAKILIKLYSGDNLQEKSEDINNLVVLLNWCFNKKNNFFITDFNKRLVHPVCDSYNKLKNNILTVDAFYCIEDLFNDIPAENIKTLRFILIRYINIYDTLIEQDTQNNDNKHSQLCKLVTKKSIKNCIEYMDSYARKLNK